MFLLGICPLVPSVRIIGQTPNSNSCIRSTTNKGKMLKLNLASDDEKAF